MYLVHIRREEDKLVRTYRDSSAWEDGSEFLWSDGNYSCDCNRALFFARAIGEHEPDDPQCGDELFAVRITDMDGNELYADDRW